MIYEIFVFQWNNLNIPVLDSAKMNSEYRSCNYRECDSRCRRLKFPGGACVNNRCKCDKLRQLLSNEGKRYYYSIHLC